jgi:hypothetical protein
VNDKKAPHGFCECPDASGLCCGGFGPATREVTRDGKRLKLCSKCDFTRDTDREYLVRPTDENILAFDYLGGFCMMGDLVSEEAWKASGFRLRYEQEWRDYWASKPTEAA